MTMTAAAAAAELETVMVIGRSSRRVSMSTERGPEAPVGDDKSPSIDTRKTEEEERALQRRRASRTRSTGNPHGIRRRLSDAII